MRKWSGFRVGLIAFAATGAAIVVPNLVPSAAASIAERAGTADAAPAMIVSASSAG